MILRTLAACACLLVVPAAMSAADPKVEDLLGKWELTEASAGIPKGATFDFKKDGKLVVVADVKGEKKSFEFKYELTKSTLKFTVGDRTDTTEIVTLDKTDLVCKDKDGTTAKFKRVKDEKKKEK
jgi:uncharacterized protein (TIGR03066 family)